MAEDSKEQAGKPKPAEHDTEPKNPNVPKEQKRQDEGQQSA
jgi:hypothetical protein